MRGLLLPAAHHFLITAVIHANSLWAASSEAASRPLKVFILAGQSNMEGPARIDTFDYIGDDPATAPLLKMMRGSDGKPAVCEGAWISYLTGREAASRVDQGPRLSRPARRRRTRESGPGPDPDSAARHGGGLCPHRDPPATCRTGRTPT